MELTLSVRAVLTENSHPDMDISHPDNYAYHDIAHEVKFLSHINFFKKTTWKGIFLIG